MVMAITIIKSASDSQTELQHDISPEENEVKYQSININIEIIFGFQEKIKWILWIIIIAESAIYLLLNIFLIKKWVREGVKVEKKRKVR